MEIAWRPTDRYLARCRLRRFAEAHGHPDFPSLYRWSVEDLEGFWRAVEGDLGFVWRTPYERVLDTSRGRSASATEWSTPRSTCTTRWRSGGGGAWGRASCWC